MNIKLKDGCFPLLPSEWKNLSQDRKEGIRIESDISAVRYTLINETVVIEDRSWGGLITVDLSIVDKFVKELTGIKEAYEY